MRNIWRIIKADARSLFTHFFALAVALAIAVLPSLYAWLNIYSNWDPYGNTGNISIAVASLDKGWTEEDGAQVNKGREVVEDLRSSTSINWVIVDTKEEAERGVYAGDYYAAVVIDEDFSYNMYHMLTEWTGKPTITYYENYKKNAVATKITDTAVSSLKTTISKSYLDVVVDAIFRGANDLSQQLSQEDPVGSVQGLLGQTRSLLRSCAKTIDAFQAAGQDNSSYRQDLSDLVSNINQNRPDGQEILDTVAQLNRKVHAALDKAQTALDKAFDAAEKFLNGIDVDAQLPEIQENLRDAAQTMDDMGDRLMAWAKSVAVEAGPVGAEAAAAAQRLADSCYQLRDRLNTVADGLKENSAVLQDTIALAAQLEKLADTLLTPVFDDVVNDGKNVLDQSEDLLQGFHGTAADTRDLLAAASAAAGTLDGLMSQGRDAMGQAIDKLGSLLGGLEDSDSPDYLDTLLDILGGNPEDYGAYFSQMVQTSVEPVYPIDNYGSAMAPFYSVLAIWVGGVMLVAILKPHARREGLVAPKPYQLFFGRYFLFFVLSQIQAAVIVAGDLLVLKIQCRGHHLPGVQPGDLCPDGFLRRRGQGRRGGGHGAPDRRVQRHLPHRAAAGRVSEDLSHLPLSLCHRRHAGVHLRPVWPDLAEEHRLPADFRRGGPAHRPVGAQALHGPEPLHGGEAGRNRNAVRKEDFPWTKRNTANCIRPFCRRSFSSTTATSAASARGC